MENWKDIDGYIGQYQVSDKGRVRSMDRFQTNINGHTRLNKRGKEVLQISLDGFLLNIYGSINEASRSLNISPGHISEVILCKRRRAGYYLWH